MNEMKKMMVVLIVCLVAILFVGVLSYKEYVSDSKFYAEFEEKFANGDTVFYIGRPTCGYCNLMNISYEEMKIRYNFSDFYINIDEISQSTLQKIMKHFNLTSVGTPYLAIVSNGKIKDVQNGFADYDGLFKFFQKNGVIAEDAELALNYIGLEEYKTILAENKLNVIVVGQSLCQYCAAAKVVLNQLVDQTNVKINYINITYLTDSESEEFHNSLEYLSKGYGTPVMFVTKKGQVVDVLEGYTTLDKYTEFLTKNGVL